MRRNGFGEVYCHNTAELRHVLMIRGLETDEVYARFEVPEPGDKATAEIVDNDGGETVCWIENQDMARVKAMIAEVEIECPE